MSKTCVWLACEGTDGHDCSYAACMCTCHQFWFTDAEECVYKQRREREADCMCLCLCVCLFLEQGMKADQNLLSFSYIVNEGSRENDHWPG